MNIASIDIGSNTILLLIAEVDLYSKKVKMLFDDQKIPRIAERLMPATPISLNKLELLLSVLADFKKTADDYNCKKILVTATNAFRIASNSIDIIDRIKENLDIDVNVVSGTEEARLTFLGVTQDLSASGTLAVIDIGGGSTEIILGTRNKIEENHSLPLGVVSLTEKYFSNNPPRENEINNLIAVIKNILKKAVINDINLNKAIAVAGTPTTLAAIKKELTFYNESLIEGEVLTAEDIMDFNQRLSSMQANEILNNYKSVVSGREDVLLAGSVILSEIMNYLRVKEVTVSTKGVRYGAIYDHILKS